MAEITTPPAIDDPVREVFSDLWARGWGEALATSEPYRKAAAAWEGSILFQMDADPSLGIPEERRIFLDLWHGDCRAARGATAADIEGADYIIRGKAAAWRRILDGKLEPMWALMSGKLRLARGSMARVVPFVKASKELLAAAQALPTSFGEAKAPAETDFAEAGPAAQDDHQPAPGRTFQSTSSRGLNFDLPPMTLWRKAKRLGIWNPEDIDFSQDREDWQGLNETEKEVILHLTSLFQAGEESVTLDLLPLIGVIAEEGRLEEEMYLTSFLWEEAKHVEIFRLFIDQVTAEASDLSRFHGESYRRIFYEALPTALRRLRRDSSPIAQAEASVTYNMIVEGVLAETGYHAYYNILEKNGLMPGMRRAVGHLKADESRHMAYGVFLLSRLVAENGDEVWQAIEERMGELLPVAIHLIKETFDPYPQMPFGLKLEHFTDFAMTQFQRRIRRIEKARGQTLAQVCRQEVA